jgi:hypothetical protein
MGEFGGKVIKITQNVMCDKTSSSTASDWSKKAILPGSERIYKD